MGGVAFVTVLPGAWRTDGLRRDRGRGVQGARIGLEWAFARVTADDGRPASPVPECRAGEATAGRPGWAGLPQAQGEDRA
jgi:hypothetical protein